jgi:hypothetical protein
VAVIKIVLKRGVDIWQVMSKLLTAKIHFYKDWLEYQG